MPVPFDKIIMGIDPGTNVMGYGLLGVRGKTPELIVMGVIKLGGFDSPYKKLHRIYERVKSLVDQYEPHELAIEAPFFGKNVQSMLKLGRAQGVAIAAALTRGIPITEYAPLSVKLAVTGSGGASKERVANMLKYILHIPEERMPHLLDATDALAVALAHYYEQSKPAVAKGAASWEAYLKAHPEKLAKRRTAPAPSPASPLPAGNAVDMGQTQVEGEMPD